MTGEQILLKKTGQTFCLFKWPKLPQKFDKNKKILVIEECADYMNVARAEVFARFLTLLVL